MKKTINFLAALALAAGMFALAPSAAAKIKWACVKNDSWLLMRMKIWHAGKFSRESKPVISGHTACIKIPEGAVVLKLRARVESIRSHSTERYVTLPQNSRHTHISVNLKSNWLGTNNWFSGGPWQWSNCGKCSYNEF